MSNNQLLQVVFACTLLFAVFAFFLILFVIRHKNQKQKYTLERQRLLFELERKELKMCVQEREIILDEVSQDVHDNIGQIANLIRMNLYSIEEQACSQDQTEAIKYVAALTNRIIEDTRHISHSLNTDFIKAQGLYKMLEYDMERINATKKLRCYIDASGDDVPISPEAQLLAYRIAQEAINNTLQHASATTLNIKIESRKDAFLLMIQDDGKGFDAANADEYPGMGLENMRKRAKLINGVLKIISNNRKGCIIILSINRIAA